jgi:hypothetical protein
MDNLDDMIDDIMGLPESNKVCLYFSINFIPYNLFGSPKVASLVC